MIGTSKNCSSLCLHLACASFVGNTHDSTVPPVEGVAGGGTSYGWSDGASVPSFALKGAIDPSEVPSSELLHVWCMPSTANVGSQEMPRQLEPMNLLAARNERESVQIALRPKVSWGSCGVAGTVQVQCNDLTSASGDRLVVGQSLKIRRVTPVLGVPDALVPLDLPVSRISLYPGETTSLWFSIDVPSDQPPGIYQGDILVLAVKADAPSATSCLGKAEKRDLFRELSTCLEIMETVNHNSVDEMINKAKSVTSNLNRVLLSQSFSEFLTDNGAADMMEEDSTLSRSVHVKISLTIWDFTLPVTPSLPAVIGVSCFLGFKMCSCCCYMFLCFCFPYKNSVKSFADNEIRNFYTILILVEGTGEVEHSPLRSLISDTVIEDRYNVEHGSSEWFDTLDMHFKWLLQYKISPYFCRWGDSMRVLTYTCPWPADHPKSDEYYSDPRLAAYAVPYCPVASCGDAAPNFLQEQVNVLKTKDHWRKAYFYLWDEFHSFPCHRESNRRHLHNFNHESNLKLDAFLQEKPSSVASDDVAGRPSDAPLAATSFEAFLKVPKYLRPHTQIYCTSEWVLGNREDLAKDVVEELEDGEEWWTYVCMGPSDPHPNWHLGMRGTQHRAVMWRIWKEGGTGFLYWGANCYEKATVSSAEVRFRRGLPPGDGVLYYPGEVFTSSREPVASLRLERLLSGLQDIEYLKLYAERYGRDESLSLLERSGLYLGPERYTIEHAPVDMMRGEVYCKCRLS
ncbi:hypothetical protein KSS87_023303 [Heliosperma pusillum]|nr:hypothetical protein KSS87_023303 [Heliosperma pusillum]